ncbi:MAG TPA: hypothetical protein VN426_17500 [Syntrophomonadaceae bacterium]|nr:hypothetical protein [Syntrophomonadaceae bacterium]
MKKYQKPLCEDIELRIEENIAMVAAVCTYSPYWVGSVEGDISGSCYMKAGS